MHGDRPASPGTNPLAGTCSVRTSFERNVAMTIGGASVRQRNPGRESRAPAFAGPGDRCSEGSGRPSGLGSASRSVRGDSGSHEREQCDFVDLGILREVDGPSGLAFEARIEET